MLPRGRIRRRYTLSGFNVWEFAQAVLFLVRKRLRIVTRPAKKYFYPLSPSFYLYMKFSHLASLINIARGDPPRVNFTYGNRERMKEKKNKSVGIPMVDGSPRRGRTHHVERFFPPARG